jgi:hypothetical protein
MRRICSFRWGDIEKCIDGSECLQRLEICLHVSGDLNRFDSLVACCEFLERFRVTANGDNSGAYCKSQLYCCSAKGPVAGAMTMVSPDLRLMSLSPPYGTINLKEVSFLGVFYSSKRTPTEIYPVSPRPCSQTFQEGETHSKVTILKRHLRVFRIRRILPLPTHQFLGPLSMALMETK